MFQRKRNSGRRDEQTVHSTVTECCPPPPPHLFSSSSPPSAHSGEERSYNSWFKFISPSNTQTYKCILFCLFVIFSCLLLFCLFFSFCFVFVTVLVKLDHICSYFGDCKISLITITYVKKPLKKKKKKKRKMKKCQISAT